MNLPPEIQFLEDVRLVIYRPRGVVDETSLNRAIAALGDLEATLQEPFNRFTDTLEAEAVELNYRYIIQVSLYRRLVYAGRPEVKSAILATDATLVHYGQLHALLTKGSPIHARVFQDRAEAAKWLELPLQLLKADAGED
jgi:hypothetical protein